jgi:hypothetical protein
MPTFIAKLLGLLVELCSVPLGLFVVLNQLWLFGWLLALALTLNAIAIVVSPFDFLITAPASIVVSIGALKLMPKISDLASEYLMPRLVQYRWKLFIKEIQHSVGKYPDQRSNFVLFLRPFDADFSTAAHFPNKGALAAHIEGMNSSETVLGYSEDGSPLLNATDNRPIHLEQWLRAVLLPWGRMVALANPGEVRKGSASYRLIVQTSEWRQVVEQLCSSAKLIVCMIASDPFVGRDPMFPAGAKPSFSQNALYASFYDEILHISKAGYRRKLLLAIPEWQMTDEKWSKLRNRLAQAGVLLLGGEWGWARQISTAGCDPCHS